MLMMAVVESFQSLTERLFREEISRARKMSPEERWRGVGELTDLALAASRAGVRHRAPTASVAEVLRICREQLARQRRREDWSIFENPGR